MDIAAIAAIAKKAGVPLIVDNTLASPYLCRPIDFGADIVVHSATKFLGGHGNSIGGVIVDGGKFDWLAGPLSLPVSLGPNMAASSSVRPSAISPLRLRCRVLGLRDLGPALSPFNAFLILTGIETLPLRMQKHSDNALPSLPIWPHNAVAWVSYPGLDADRYNALARKYCPKGAGAVFTFGLKGGYEAGVKLVSSVKLFSHLANVGDTRSLIIHPASTTHRQLSTPRRSRRAQGRMWCGFRSASRTRKI